MRRGTTLIEVLIAIFIMALGLVALLTLFPIGAVQMARAIQDERAAQVAANSAAYFRMYWRTMCENEQARLASLPGGTASAMFRCDPLSSYQAGWFTAAMDDPNAGLPPAYQKASVFFDSPTNTLANIAAKSFSSQPGFAVMIDPVGWEGARTGGSPTDQLIQHWVGATPPNGFDYAMPRRTLTELNGPLNGPTTMSTKKPMSTRMCYLLDDMTFYRNGTAINPDVATPALPSPPLMDRPWKDSSYSCAYLVRRGNNSDRGRLNLTVIVYSKKSIDATPNEPAYLGVPQVGIIPADVAARRPDTVVWGNTVTMVVKAGQEAPPIRRGTWILDATLERGAGTGAGASGVFSHGYFYRVTDVLERIPATSTDGSITVQLETNLRPGPMLTSTTPAPRLFVVPDGILDVFDKGPLDPNSPPRVN